MKTNMEDNKMKVECSLELNQTTGKPIKHRKKPQGKAFATIQRNVTRVVTDFENLCEKLVEGVAFKPAVVNTMGDDGFNYQQIFCIDIDNDIPNIPILTIDDCFQIANENHIPIAFSYYSYSNSAEKPKFRLLFLADRQTGEGDEVIAINKYLIHLFPQADPVCFNLGRLFLGTNQGTAFPCNSTQQFNFNEIRAKAMKWKEEQEKIQLQSRPIKIYENSISDDIKDAIERIKENSESYLSEFQVKTGYICPCCSSGTGKNKTGITLNKKSMNPYNYHCFACGWNGDIISYHQQKNSLEFMEAIKDLCDMFNIELNFKHSDHWNHTPIIAQQHENKEKEQENIFNKILRNLVFKPNYTIDFVQNAVMKIKTGSGKTYNLVQKCLNKIINGTGNRIIIATATNDLVYDFCLQLVKAFQNICKENDIELSMEPNQLLKQCKVLALNLDAEMVENFDEFDIIITNHSYLFPLGDTTFFSLKILKLQEFIEEMKMKYDIYIDECHVMEKYKYSFIPLGQLVVDNANETLGTRIQKTTDFFTINDIGTISPNTWSRKAMMNTNNIGIQNFKYHEKGLINLKTVMESMEIVGTRELKKNCIFIHDDFKIYHMTYALDILIGIDDLYDPKLQNFKNLIHTARDYFMIETAILIEQEHHDDFIARTPRAFHDKMNEILQRTDYNAYREICTKINFVNKRFGTACFSQTLQIEKPSINLENFNCYYTTATTDNISKKYKIIEVNHLKQPHNIKTINVLFASLHLKNRLQGSSLLSLQNINDNNKKITTIVMAEKWKIDEMMKGANKKQLELNNTSFHKESATLLSIDDTKPKQIATNNKITYLQETRQTGTNFDKTEVIIIDGKRSIHATESYNRYVTMDGELVVHFKDVTTVTFEHMKQVIGRILRGNIEKKAIVFCLPDPPKGDKANNLTDYDFDVFKFIELIKNYFATEFPEIELIYDEQIKNTNKTHLVKKVANWLGLEETITKKKEVRNDKICERYQELKKEGLDRNVIFQILKTDYNLSQQHLAGLVKNYTKKISDTAIIQEIRLLQLMGHDKTSIINMLDDDEQVSRRRLYQIFKKYDLDNIQISNETIKEMIQSYTNDLYTKNEIIQKIANANISAERVSQLYDET